MTKTINITDDQIRVIFKIMKNEKLNNLYATHFDLMEGTATVIFKQERKELFFLIDYDATEYKKATIKEIPLKGQYQGMNDEVIRYDKDADRFLITYRNQRDKYN